MEHQLNRRAVGRAANTPSADGWQTRVIAAYRQSAYLRNVQRL
jgi:hypothetical protein